MVYILKMNPTKSLNYGKISVVEYNPGTKIWYY